MKWKVESVGQRTVQDIGAMGGMFEMLQNHQNMGMQSFEESLAWIRAQDLLEVVETGFEESRRFWFKDQICRATLSIGNNIAEGFGRPTRAEWNRYLVIARGSCNEVRSMLLYAKRRQYLPVDEIERGLGLTIEIGRLTNSYMSANTRRFGHLPGYLGLLGFASWFETFISGPRLG